MNIALEVRASAPCRQRMTTVLVGVPRLVA